MKEHHEETSIYTAGSDNASAQSSPAGERRIWSFWHYASSVLLALAVGFCLIISVQIARNGYVEIAGYSMFRVVTGSMEPTISVGEALICEKTEIGTIQVGEIVCYLTQVSEIRGSVVTHRVVAVDMDAAGEICLETRGDANLATDPYLVRAENLVGRVIWRSGEESIFTDILSFLTGKIGFLTCIVFPVVLAAGMILQSSMKSLRRELQSIRRELKDLETDGTDTSNGDNLQPLPGYTFLTQKDYDELLETLRAELIGELQNHATGNQQEHT